MSNHPIVHVDIPTHDPKAASKFYADAFDWQIQVDASSDYHKFQAEGGPGGGFVSTSGDFALEIGKPLCYIQTDDIDASLAKITALGGKVLQPKTDLGAHGSYALFADPSGNKMGLYTGPKG